MLIFFTKPSIDHLPKAENSYFCSRNERYTSNLFFDRYDYMTKVAGRCPFLRFLILVAFLFHVFSATAQMARMYTIQQGLTTSDISDIYIDSKGMVLLPGLASLDLFDGVSFHHDFHQAFMKQNLVNSFSGVVELSDDRYLVKSSNGLMLFDVRKNDFRHLLLDEAEDSVKGYPITSLVEYRQKDCFIVSAMGGGLFAIDRHTAKVNEALTHRLKSKVSSKLCGNLYVDSDENLWINTSDRKMIAFHMPTMNRLKLNITPDAEQVITDGVVSSMIQQRTTGNMLFTTGEGVVIFDRSTKTLRMSNGSKAIANMLINQIYETHEGKLLVGTDGMGVWQMGVDEMFSQYSFSEFHLNLNHAKVRVMAEDSDGNMIMVIFQKGIIVIPDRAVSFNSIFPENDFFQSSCVTSMTSTSDGRYWIGTDGRGVYVCEEGNLDAAHPVEIGENAKLVQSIVVDKSEGVWVGSYGGGVKHYEQGRFVTPLWLSTLSSELIMSMAYDARNNILYIGTNGNGVYVADLDSKQLSPLTLSFDINQWISNLYFDSEGILWIATMSGIFYYDRNSSTLGDSQGEVKFGNSDIIITRCIAKIDDMLYFGTNKGLVEYNPRSKQGRYVIEGKDVMSVVATASDIWCSTSQNIISINKSTGNVHQYSSIGSFFVGEFHRSSFMAHGGRIYFGGDNGIISFVPSHIVQGKPLRHPILLSSLKVNGSPIEFHEGASDNFTESYISSAKCLKLPHSQNSFGLEFYVPVLSSFEQIHYQYMLEGYEDTWHDATSEQRELHYSSLPSGHYNLIIRAFYESDKDHYKERILEVEVGYPWYATPWARLLYLLLAIVGVVAAYRFHCEQQKQKRLLNQAKQAEQLKEAKLHLFTSITHELRSPLTMIISPLNQLMSTTDNPETASLYKVMRRNCDKLLGIVKQMTDIRKIDNGQFHLHFSEVNFIDYADEIFSSFAAIQAVKQISFTVEHASQNIMLWIDTVHFEKILTNILSNAFKFTPEGGKIFVRTCYIIRNSNDWLEIRIYNSGSHIDGNDLPHIFERFYQGSQSGATVGSGIGLNLASELVNLHHGTISCHNIDPDGVEFVLQFPIGSKHLSEEEVLPRPVDETAPTESSQLAELTEIATIEQQNANTSENRQKKTILIVDDDKSLCLFIREQMADDYNILLAHSGNAAWQTVLTSRPDAVVTDIRMPDGDGLQLCQRIKHNPETDNIPIIMLTSENGDRAQINSLNLQVDHFLSKPFNMLVLKGVVAQAIRVREQMLGRIRRAEIDYDYSRVTVDSADEQLYARINSALRDHIDDSSFGVNELAAEVGISRVHLNRKLKEQYGITPNLFIRSFRMKQAAYLLAGGKASISEVADRVGYSSHSHFSNTFHDYFGMTPKEFVATYSDNLDDESLQKLLQ